MNHPVLDLPMGENDAERNSVRHYLEELLLQVIHKQGQFNGKRPFGNSGWFTCELGPPLVKAGLVEGTLDEEGYVVTCNEVQLAAVLRTAIGELFQKP